MAATIVWIGGLFYQAVVVGPALDYLGGNSGQFMRAVGRRFQPLAWLSLFVLVGTGLVQMSASSSYVGLLSLANPWSQAIFVKHLLIGAMVLVAAYQTWVVNPRVVRMALLKQDDASADLARELRRLNRLSLVLGIFVLGLTALARTA